MQFKKHHSRVCTVNMQPKTAVAQVILNELKTGKQAGKSEPGVQCLEGCNSDRIRRYMKSGGSSTFELQQPEAEKLNRRYWDNPDGSTVIHHRNKVIF